MRATSTYKKDKHVCMCVIFSSGFSGCRKNADLYDGFIHRGVIVCAHTMYTVHTEYVWIDCKCKRLWIGELMTVKTNECLLNVLESVCLCFSISSRIYVHFLYFWTCHRISFDYKSNLCCRSISSKGLFFFAANSFNCRCNPERGRKKTLKICRIWFKLNRFKFNSFLHDLCTVYGHKWFVLSCITTYLTAKKTWNWIFFVVFIVNGIFMCILWNVKMFSFFWTKHSDFISYCIVNPSACIVLKFLSSILYLGLCLLLRRLYYFNVNSGFCLCVQEVTDRKCIHFIGK